MALRGGLVLGHVEGCTAGYGYWVGTRVGIPVGYQEGYTGVLPSHPARSPTPAKRAPEGPAGAWSGWV